jgi:hypothetical protein
LSVLLGGGLVAVAAALLLTVTIEGGRRMTRLNLREVVTTYNSVEAYQPTEAAAALKRLDTSKKVAGVGAVLAFLGLLVTLWIPAPPGDPASVPQHAPTTSKPLVRPTP